MLLQSDIKFLQYFFELTDVIIRKVLSATIIIISYKFQDNQEIIEFLSKVIHIISSQRIIMFDLIKDK